MSDYEVTLVNDNSKFHPTFPVLFSYEINLSTV